MDIDDKKVLLYSGGLDSFLISYLWEPDIKLYFNIKGSYSKEEISKLPEDVQIIDFDLSEFEREDKIIPLRNLYFILMASNFGGHICLGATKGDRVLDKSLEFASKANDLLNYLYSPQWWLPKGRIINIDFVFKNMNKKDLLKAYVEKGGDLETAYNKSFSCYYPDEFGDECWNCKPCFRKWIAFASMGYIKHYKPLTYIENNIIPLIKNGTYGRSTEEKIILDIYNKYRSLNEK